MKAKLGPKPPAMELAELGRGSASRLEVRVLVPTQWRGSPHVLLDARRMDGVAELGVVQTRRLHDWLTRYLAWFEESKATEDPNE